MKNNQIRNIVAGMMGWAATLIMAGCGSATGGISEANSVISTPSGDSPTVAGSSGGVSITNTYSSPKELGVGDILYADLSSTTSLDFSGVSESAEFALVLANTSAAKGNFTVQVSGDLSSADFDVAKSVDAVEDSEGAEQDEDNLNEIFHEVLRLREKDLETLPPSATMQSFSASKAASAGASASISEGESRSFKVLASLSSSTSTVNVTAVAECVGSNVAFYVDERVTDAMLSNADVESLCQKFDDIAGREQQLFGSVSDVNGDGKVVVLLTPQVNRLGALGGGIVTGFFSATDLYESSASNPASNYMEILYIMVPDPSGTYGTAISKSFALSNLLPAVLPHELQHAISYHQHVLVAGGSAEESWLNEGLSHMAEDIFGHNQENPSRYAMYLANPSSYALVTPRSPSLASRGGAYLFLRFLYEQADNGNQFLARMVSGSQRGVANVEQAFGGRAGDFDQFGEFYLRWNAALVMTDAGLSQDSRYVYKGRSRDSGTGNWSGVCIRCGADDNRGTALSGVSLKTYDGFQNATTGPTSSRYYKVSKVDGKMSFAGATGGEGYGILIRTK